MSWKITNREDYMCRVRPEISKLESEYSWSGEFDDWEDLSYKTLNYLDSIFSSWNFDIHNKKVVLNAISKKDIIEANKMLKKLEDELLLRKLET